MRLSVLSLLLLVAALASSQALPAPAPEDLFGGPADCEHMIKVFCSRATWVSDNDLLRTWQVVPDHILQDGDTHEHFDTEGNSEQWQHLELQNSPRHYENDDGKHNHADIRSNDPNLPGVMVILVLNKDVLIENEKAYFVYDSILASTNPFVAQRYSLKCFHKYMTQTTQNENDIIGQDANVDMEVVFQKREDSDMGQKEIPDVLYFNEKQNGQIHKKLFSFWSRLQGLSPRGRPLPARRQGFVYYGPDGAPLSAEPRAARPRPPGQPLRWG